MARASERRPTTALRQGRALWRWARVGGLLGALSCNALLGIGEASLRCDMEPCPPDTPAAGDLPPSISTEPAAPTPDAVAEPTPDAVPAPSGGDPSANEDVRIGDGPLQSAPGAAGGVRAPDDAGPGGSPDIAPAPDAGSGSPPLACDRDDACGVCLCGACREQFDACERTQGCLEIVACARLNRCSGVDCYCGTDGAIACGTGGGDGPCFAVTRAAPGFREPTLLNPSAGPASDAALGFGSCVSQDALCDQACSGD